MFETLSVIFEQNSIEVVRTVGERVAPKQAKVG